MVSKLERDYSNICARQHAKLKAKHKTRRLSKSEFRTIDLLRHERDNADQSVKIIHGEEI
jgi:hypothetical protein